MAVTLAQLITRIRQRTDTENSEFITDAELTQLINTSYKELYGLLVRASLHRAETTYAVVTDGSASYTLPTDFFGLIGVYRTYSQDKVPLERFPDKFRPGERTGDATMYRVVGSAVVLYPKPSSGTYDLVYIPVPGELVSAADELDGVLGWEEFVVLDAAINVLEKEGSNTTTLERKRAMILQRISDEAQMVEFTETPRIQNVRAPWRDLSDPADWAPGRGDGYDDGWEW
jgi:hypothetical protein